MTEIAPEGFGYYDVKGVDRPLLLEDGHAKELKGKRREESDPPAEDAPKAPAAKSDKA